jgi:hypothetical protein
MSKKGKATGTSASVQMLAADVHRDYVVIMLQNAVACAIGIYGEDAVADEGILLAEIGDTVHLTGSAARSKISVIGNTASLTWQESDEPIIVHRQGYLA